MTNYAIVAGHNGIITGAFGCGYAEHLVARQIKDKVIVLLRQLGHTAIDCTDEVGRTKEQVWMNAAKNTDRAIGSNGIAVSIHLNASPGGTGTEVYDYKGTQAALARKVSASLTSAFGWKDRGQKNGDWIGYIAETKAPAILIEVCFIDCKSDMDKLMSDLDKAAKAIVEGLTGQKITTPQPPQSVPAPAPMPTKGEVVYISTGGYAGAALGQVHDYLFRTGHNFDCKRGADGSIVFLIGRFDTSQQNFKDCEQFFRTNGHVYELVAWEKAEDWK